MENKLTDKKILETIKKVNDALNAMGQKMAKKINELMEDISELREEVNNMKNCNCDCELNKREVDYDKEIKHIENMYQNNRDKIVEITLKLSNLEKELKKTLTNGVKDHHLSKNASKKNDQPQKNIQEYMYHCDECGEKFTDCYSFDIHKVTFHDSEQNYQCNECEIRFFSDWKLKKHMRIHQTISTRKCHYFNNNKQCPFEKFGCKFLHLESDNCKYASNCNRTKCPYRH